MWVELISFAGIRSFTIQTRSWCGECLGWPVVSSHFLPRSAPQIGQRIFSIRLGDSSLNRVIIRAIVSRVNVANLFTFAQVAQLFAEANELPVLEMAVPLFRIPRFYER
jgi:hypothetical protein